MPTPTFTPRDAEFLIAHAQTAPLANMQHAEKVSVLLQRFKTWYEHVGAQDAAPEKPDRKPRKEKSGSTEPDPTS